MSDFEMLYLVINFIAVILILIKGKKNNNRPTAKGKRLLLNTKLQALTAFTAVVL